MPETILLTSEEKMEKTIEVFKNELALIRTGRANPAVLNGVKVSYYGTLTPLNQIASLSVPEATQLVIKPYDKNSLKDIEKAIQAADLNLTPLNDGVVIRINFPALNEQRRKEFVKDVKTKGENSKVAMRNIRRDAMDQLKKMEKDSLITEDDLKKYSDDVQKLLDKEIAKVDQEIATKEKLIMEI